MNQIYNPETASNRAAPATTHKRKKYLCIVQKLQTLEKNIKYI